MKKTSKKQKAEFKRRSLAAKLGWRTREQKRLKRSRAAKKGARTRAANRNRISLPTGGKALNREFLISVEYKGSGRKKKRRGLKADLLMVAKPDSDATQLADQARKQLKSNKFLANWIEGGHATISKGEFVDRRPSTKIRSFKRLKP